MEHRYTRNRSKFLVIFALLGFAALLTLWRTFTMIYRQDGDFQQSDWLISFSGGLIRRGISGETIFWLSDWTGANPLLIIGVFVSLLIIAIFGSVLARAFQLKMNDRILIALLSPGFLLFWANDFGGAHRKEIIAFAAFLPLVTSKTTEVTSYILRILVVFLFGISIAFHEANVFLAPMLIAAMLVRFPDQGIRNAINGTLILVVAAAGAIFALNFSSIESTEPLCQRVLSYGLSSDLCGGAFDWLLNKIDDGVDETTAMFNTVSISIAVLLTIICIGPVVALLTCLRFSKIEIASIVVATLSVLPLFIIAIDWGRWVALVTFGLTFIGLIRAGHTDAYLRSPDLPSGQRAAAIAVSLGVGIGHVSIAPIGGYIYTILQSIARVTP